MNKYIITGKHPRGSFVFIGPYESRPELARRWLKYGFNDYVTGRYGRSLFDYERYEVESKADDERGRWIKNWMYYGYKLAILFYEVIHPDYTPEYNAFRRDADFIEFLNIDYSHKPPDYDNYDDYDLYEKTHSYSVVRVLSEDNATYRTIDFCHSGNEYRDIVQSLVKLGYPDYYECVSIHYWKKGVKA